MPILIRITTIVAEMIATEALTWVVKKVRRRKVSRIDRFCYFESEDTWK